MEEKKYPRIISDKKYDEWINTCPLQIKEIIVEQADELSAPDIKVITCPCGDFEIIDFSMEAELYSLRKELIGRMHSEKLTSPESEPVKLDDKNTVYAVGRLTEVRYTRSGEVVVWKNTDNRTGEKLPAQEIYWQTDPLYEQIKRECSGVTDAKFKPLEKDGYWICTCGQVNLHDSEKCGACHVSLEWLHEHLDTEYLGKRKIEDDKKSDKQIKREIKQRREGISDKTKAILILSALLAVVVLIVLVFKLFIPSAKYSGAEKALEAGEYDEAISAFSELDSFRDSKDRLSDATYKKAQFMTGIENVYTTTSVKEPWYSIDENGVLSFNKDKYTGNWDNFVIPDVVDGIIVRELERNFFINCKELTVVTISDCVEVLGEQVFYNCELLNTIYFGKNLKVIGQRAFINCYALENIEIPDTVTSLGIRAFNNCTSLESVILGSGITEIGSYQFSYCTKLRKITVKSPISEIGEYAFTECNSFETVFCRFGESEWTDPVIKEGNEIFETAKLSFNN